MLERGEEPLTYEQLVDYSAMDPAKVNAQAAASTTVNNLHNHFGQTLLPESLGESVQVWDEGDRYGAGVLEGLGTKNLVAKQVDADNPENSSKYKEIAQDTIAMIDNDLIVSGAKAKLLWLHVAAGESSWFTDMKRISAFNLGCAAVCNEIGITWPGGESPTLPGVIVPGAAELSGFILGEIKPKDRYVPGNRVQEDDRVVLVESSGIHANGLTSARELAKRLPAGYSTKLSDGTSFGEALLRPTILYSPVVQELLDRGIEVHRMENITGHGWRKLMRARQPFTYRMYEMPPTLPIFEFLQEQLGVDDAEMLGNYNCGAGFAFYIPKKDVSTALEVLGDCAWEAGRVEAGPKKVIIEPKDVIFEADTLGVR